VSEENEEGSWIHIKFVPMDKQQDLGYKIGLETHQISEQMIVIGITTLMTELTPHSIEHLKELCEYSLNHKTIKELPN